LHVTRHIADFIQKDCAPFGFPEEPVPTPQCTSERAFLVPEEQTLKQCVWKSGAVYGNEFALTAPLLMDALSDDFFPSTCLASNQDRRIGTSTIPNRWDDAFDCLDVGADQAIIEARTDQAWVQFAVSPRRGVTVQVVIIGPKHAGLMEFFVIRNIILDFAFDREIVKTLSRCPYGLKLFPCQLSACFPQQQCFVF
jgi:hypothetical protein